MVGDKYLVLCDGGANGFIIGLDMHTFYFNSDGKRFSIRITVDHQLTDHILCICVTLA